jgi:phosphatidyl-myo-inositol dimannoside synthase
MRHLLVTNDFPPKLGGIQSYLWELWRRLPADEVTVLTTAHEGDAAWDREQAFRVERVGARVLLPTPALAARIRALADEVDAELVLLDPAFWGVGLLGPRLGRPYGLVVHGAEVTVPGRLPGARRVLSRVLRGASVLITAGGYPADEAERAARRGLPVLLIPPGVDVERFAPLDLPARAAARSRFGLPGEGPIVTSVSRLVPRKGMDVLIRAVAELAPAHPGLVLALAGSGRDRGRLVRLARTARAPVQFLGSVPDADLPALFGCGDAFAMLCRDRWLGLESEGFGIVFLEAAACGIPQVAGASGGSAEAVVDGVTGTVVRHPTDVEAVRAALHELLVDTDRRERLGASARERAEREFSYDVLAARLEAGLEKVGPA